MKLLKRKFFTILCVIIIFLILIIIYKLKFEDILLKKIYITQYNEYVEKYSKEYDVDKFLIYAIIKAESNFEEEVVSSKGAKGLMQLMDTTAQEIAQKIGLKIDEENVLEPEYNIQLGTYYISILIKKYNCIELALAAYNAGSGNVDSWIENDILKEDGSNIENIPFKETNNYVRKILRDYKIYCELW